MTDEGTETKERDKGKEETAREDTVRSFLRELYGREMAPTIAAAWVIALIYIALAVWSAVKFFGTDDAKLQILWATIFLASFMAIGLVKVFAVQMVHRQNLKRAIKKLEAQVTQLEARLDQKNR